MMSVCLNHGKPEPGTQMTYRLVPLETYTSDVALQRLLIAVGSGQLEPGAAQAAAWHLSDAMSWDELSEKKIEHLGGIEAEPYFSAEQIAGAREAVAAARAAVSDGETKTKAATETAPGRERNRRSRR
jgi:hypothetical protein